MRKTWLSASLGLGLWLGTAMAKDSMSFGKLSTPSPASISLHEAFEKKENLMGKTIAVTGLVKKVCEQKGCWLTLEDKSSSVRVTFQGYSFFVSEKLKDRSVVAEGKWLKKERTVEDLQHFAKDAGESPEKIKAITKPEVSYEFEASGVKTL